MIAIGLTTHSEQLDRRPQLVVQRTCAFDVAGSEALHHLLHLWADDVRVHAHAAPAADLEEREDQVVVAREEVEPELDDPSRLRQVVVRLLDRSHGRNLGELGDRLGLEVQDHAAGDVVDDERSVGDRGHGLEVLDDPAHRRLVVVRRHDQEAVDPDLVRTLGEVDGVLGRVRPRSGDDGRPVADLVNRRLVEREALGIRERGRLTGGSRDDQAIRAVVDEMRGERSEALEVDRAVRLERGDDRGQDLALHRQDSTKPSSSSSVSPG